MVPPSPLTKGEEEASGPPWGRRAFQLGRVALSYALERGTACSRVGCRVGATVWGTMHS